MGVCVYMAIECGDDPQSGERELLAEWSIDLDGSSWPRSQSVGNIPWALARRPPLGFSLARIFIRDLPRPGVASLIIGRSESLRALTLHTLGSGSMECGKGVLRCNLIVTMLMHPSGSMAELV